jgi:hypothetical protein
VKPAKLWLALTVALVALALACRVDRTPQGPAALIFAATAVAGTALYREATGGCWAACNAGWVCNPTTGRCEPIARDPQQRLQRPTPSATPAAPSEVAADAGSAETPDAEPTP